MTNIRYGYERWIDGSAGNTEVVNAGLHALIFTSTRPHIENVPFLVLASISTSILQKSDNSDLIIFLSPGLHWLCRPFFSCCLSASFKITRFAPQCLGVKIPWFFKNLYTWLFVLKYFIRCMSLGSGNIVINEEFLWRLKATEHRGISFWYHNIPATVS